MYSDLKGSGLLQQATEGRNRKKVLSALDELNKREVLVKYKVENKMVGNKIIDVKYTVFPTEQFSTEQKAANKRDSIGKSRVLKMRLPRQ